MNKILINFFFLLLLIPALNLVFKFKVDIPSTEKKREISLGEILSADITKKFSLIEESFEQNFPARNWIIQKYNYFLWFVLDSTPKRGVLKGKNDWLFIFLGKGANGRDYSYNEGEFSHYKDGLEKVRNLCNEKGVKFYSAIVPEKFNIYPEYLFETDNSTIKRNKYFQIFNELNRSSDETLFFHNELNAAKKKRDVYYKTDTHWNNIAALIASNKIFAKMGLDDSRIRIMDEAEFDLLNFRTSGRDISEFLSLAKYFKDEEYLFIPKSNLKKRAKVLKILVIHDSYFYPMISFFKYQFQEVDTWNFVQQNSPVHYNELMKKKPDILLFIALERHIGNYDSRVFDHL